MKKIAIITILFLVSCQNTHIREGKLKEVADKEEATTLKTINSMDTNNTYYLYTKGQTLYLIDTNTRKVQYKMTDSSGEMGTAMLVFIGLFFILGMIIGFSITY